MIIGFLCTVQIETLVSLKSKNTFGFPVIAEECVSIKDVRELIELQKTGFFTQEVRIIGGGSNILITKSAIPRVLLNKIEGIDIIEENQDFVTVNFGSGIKWHDAVLYCVERNWGGIENLSLIPGSIGAAPIQNIGAYGVELKDTFHSLQALNLKSGDVVKFNNEECRFGYRDSIFKNEHKGEYLITSVALRLSKKPEINTSYGDIRKVLNEKKIENPSIRDVSNAVIDIRSSKLPNPELIGNSGSFFKNPVISDAQFSELKFTHPDIKGYTVNESHTKVPAGWLIEKAGWKGYRDGNIGVHAKQALVLVHYGGSHGEKIRELAERIQTDVRQKFGISLEFEVNIW